MLKRCCRNCGQFVGVILPCKMYHLVLSAYLLLHLSKHNTPEASATRDSFASTGQLDLAFVFRDITQLYLSCGGTVRRKGAIHKGALHTPATAISITLSHMHTIIFLACISPQHA